MRAGLKGFRSGLAAALSFLVAAAPVLGGGGPRDGRGVPRSGPGRAALREPARRQAQKPPPVPRQAPEDPHGPGRMRARLRARLDERAKARTVQAAQGPLEPLAPPPEISLPGFEPPPMASALRPSLRPQRAGLGDWMRFLFLLLTLSHLLPVAGGELLHPEPPPLGPEAGFQGPPAGHRSPPAPDPGRPPPDVPGTATTGRAPTGTAGTGSARPLPDGVPGPAGQGLPALLQSHAHFVANQTAAFNQTLVRALPRPATHRPPDRSPGGPETGQPIRTDLPDQALPPTPPPYLAQATALAQNITSVHGTGAAPATLAELGSRLALARQWVAQELDQARTLAGGAGGPSGPPGLLAGMTAQLAALDGLAAGMQALLAGYQAGMVSPTVAIGLIRQASDSIINVVNSFRVVAQSTALTAYPPRLEQIRTQMGQVLDRLLADLELDRRDGSGQTPADPVTGSPEPLAPARQEKACCDYVDLLTQFTIQGILGAGGAANVAAYTVATEAEGEAAGIDFLRSGNTTLTTAARALLAATDMTAVSAGVLGSQVLAPPPGAVLSPTFSGPGLDTAVWGNASSALAARCGSVHCDRPVTAIRARVAGETLAGSILNLIGFILFSVAEQLDIAMKLEHGSLVPIPGTVPGRSAAWMDTLMQNFHAQAVETLPPRNLTALLDAVPVLPPEGPAFPGVRPGLDDAQTLRLVLHTATETLHKEAWPTLAGLAPGSFPPALQLADLLARFHRLAATGLAQRGLAAGAGNPAVETRWQVLANLATYSRYASAVAVGWRSGALGRSSALTLLGDLADTLQTLVYGWLIEASAVPLEVSLLYRGGAGPHLVQARARALGLPEPSGTGGRRCRDWCHYVDLRTQAATETTARTATRIYLAAYIEALTGSIITQAVDAVDAFSPTAAARNGTWGTLGGGAPTTSDGQVQAESVDTQDTAQAPGGSTGTAPAGTLRSSLDPAALETLLVDAPARTGRMDEREALLESVCADAPCDESFSRQQRALAEETRSGSELTFLAYTLNLVVKGFRIALAAGR